MSFRSGSGICIERTGHLVCVPDKDKNFDEVVRFSIV